LGFYPELIRSVFQAVDQDGKLRHRIVAVTSAAPKEGVSYLVNTLAKELATQTHKRVLAVDALALQNLSVAEPSQISRHCSETQIDNLLTLPVEAAGVGLMGPRGSSRFGDWLTDPKHRSACLKALRWNFDYVLIDCPSLTLSSEATTLAPAVDGVCIVVEAGRTRRGQIQRAQQIIESSGGNFLGFVLNRIRYPVPNWLYQRL